MDSRTFLFFSVFCLIIFFIAVLIKLLTNGSCDIELKNDNNNSATTQNEIVTVENKNNNKHVLFHFECTTEPTDKSEMVKKGTSFSNTISRYTAVKKKSK